MLKVTPCPWFLSNLCFFALFFVSVITVSGQVRTLHYLTRIYCLICWYLYVDVVVCLLSRAGSSKRHQHLFLVFGNLAFAYWSIKHIQLKKVKSFISCFMSVRPTAFDKTSVRTYLPVHSLLCCANVWQAGSNPGLWLTASPVQQGVIQLYWSSG